MARRSDRDEFPNVLNAEDLKHIRHHIAHLSLSAVQEMYESALEECRLVNARLPNPRQIQMLVQIWKQLWMWRR